jgi:hypothetical protein
MPPPSAHSTSTGHPTHLITHHPQAPPIHLLPVRPQLLVRLLGRLVVKAQLRHELGVLQHLRREVVGRACKRERVSARDGGAVRQEWRGGAEVGQEEAAVGGEEEVVGFDVADDMRSGKNEPNFFLRVDEVIARSLTGREWRMWAYR